MVALSPNGRSTVKHSATNDTPRSLPILLDDDIVAPQDLGMNNVATRLLESSRTLSFDPDLDCDWDAPISDDMYGLNPEWSTLYGTPLWDQLSHAQRVTLTRHEVASVASTGIWFEMILNQLILRAEYRSDHTKPDFLFALTEIGDECRHSKMFAQAAYKLSGRSYRPNRLTMELGRAAKSWAYGEIAYAAILVAEEMLDIMQRDWMRGENVVPLVRKTSYIHVVEESRHMRFARQEIRDYLAGASAARRHYSAVTIALVARFIVVSMVHPDVYAAVGLDPKETFKIAQNNEHRRTMLRVSSVHLMDFLSEVGLLNRPAVAIYRRIGIM